MILHRLQSLYSQGLQSRSQGILGSSCQGHSCPAQIRLGIQHRAVAVEVVEALRQLAGVRGQLMRLELPGGSVDDQIKLCDLLDEGDLVFAGEQIGLDRNAELPGPLALLLPCAGCCRRGHVSTG